MDKAALHTMQEYFDSGATRSYDFRRKQLQLLYKALEKWEAKLHEALYADLHKSAEESYVTETGFTKAEISHALEHLHSWVEVEHVNTPFALFRSKSEIIHEPWGVSLIIAPWNYPVQLVLGPLVGAIAGGNCAVLKPSEFAPHVAGVLAEMIKDTYREDYIKVVKGDGATLIPDMINSFRFGHVFYTGSTKVGREIAMLTAAQFIPTVLELGGKSPCIVAEDANIKVAAKRIAWGKFTNAGQTCVAPDYVLVQEGIKDELIAALKGSIDELYGKADQSADYGRIINDKHYERLCGYLNEGQIIYGGQTDKQNRYISPTLLADVQLTDTVMQEEIFGPVLPVISYRTEQEAKNIIARNPDPLALYLFTNNKKTEDSIMEGISFGGGCVNNTLVHLANSSLPFGGVAASGIGKYHGKYGFETFTRPKAIVKTANFPDVPMKYPPYKGKMRLFRWLLK